MRSADVSRDQGNVTCYGAQQPQGRGVPLVLVDHPLARRHRDGDGQRDRLVELASPGLNGHDRGHGHSVTQQLSGQLRRYGLGLQTEIINKQNKMRK